MFNPNVASAPVDLSAPLTPPTPSVTDADASTWLYYVDESYDTDRFCLAAVGLKAGTWRGAFDRVKAYRRQLKDSDGVFLRTEIHARDLVAGRGELGSRVIGKWRRSRIFYELLELVASLPHVHLFNICLERSGRRDPQLDAWDRLLNRINRMCEERNRQENARRRGWLRELRSAGVAPATCDELDRRLLPYSAHAMILADKGRETEIVRLKRRLTVMNYVPSRFGAWAGGEDAKNIPLTHLVEDALFRDSEHSYFIQLTDCVAFALLKREATPTPLVKRYAIHRAFDAHLAGVCTLQASPRDPLGIVRK